MISNLGFIIIYLFYLCTFVIFISLWFGECLFSMGRGLDVVREFPIVTGG